MSNKKRKLKEIRLSNALLSGKRHVYAVLKITNDMLDSCKIPEKDFIQLQVQSINKINMRVPRLNRMFDFKLLEWTYGMNQNDFEQGVKTVEVKFRVLKKKV